MNVFRGARRRVAGAAVVAIAAAATVLAATPAHAASATLIHPEWVDGCPGCPGPVDFGFAVEAQLDERVATEVGGLVARGTELLLEGAQSRDRRAASRLTAAGIATLSDASAQAGHAQFVRSADWDGGWCGNEPKPWPHPKDWYSPVLAEAETSLADGLTMLGAAATESDAETQQALQARAVDALTGAAGQLANFG